MDGLVVEQLLFPKVERGGDGGKVGILQSVLSRFHEVILLLPHSLPTNSMKDTRPSLLHSTTIYCDVVCIRGSGGGGGGGGQR